MPFLLFSIIVLFHCDDYKRMAFTLVYDVLLLHTLSYLVKKKSNKRRCIAAKAKVSILQGSLILKDFEVPVNFNEVSQLLLAKFPDVS